MIQKAKFIISLSCAISLTGCASLNSTYWTQPGPGKTRVNTVDAFQRHLIIARNPDDNKVRVCAEASPDAMTVFSSSLTGRFNLTGSEQQAVTAAAMGQTAASLERTQTVNLLRESMYRTCERWLSGAITKDEFMALAAREHRSMVAILAIEQLTGVVKPPATVISGPAVQAAMNQGEKTVELLEAYRKEREAAVAAETAALKDWTELNVDHADGNGGTKKLCELESAPDDAKDKWESCAATKAKHEQASKLATEARARETKVLDQLQHLNDGLAAAVSGGSFNTGGLNGAANRPSDAAWVLIGETVEKIALTSGINEPLLFCARYLSKDRTDPETRETCNNVLTESANSDKMIVSETFGFEQGPDVTAATRNNVVMPYTETRLKLGTLFSKTPEGEWNRLWKEFVKSTGFSTFSCQTTLDCLRRIGDSTQTPFLTLFLTNPDQLSDSMDTWSKALDALNKEDENG